MIATIALMMLTASEPTLDLTLHPGLDPRPVCRAPKEARCLYLGEYDGRTLAVPVSLAVRNLPDTAPDGRPWRDGAEVVFGLTFVAEGPAGRPLRLPRGQGKAVVRRGEDGTWRPDADPGPLRMHLGQLPQRGETLANARQHTHAKPGIRHAAWHPEAEERWTAGFWAYVRLTDQAGERHEILIKQPQAAPGVCVDMIPHLSPEQPQGHEQAQ